jgi:hypothetical protein
MSDPVYLYFFHEDGVVETNQFPPTKGDEDAVQEGVLDVIKLALDQPPLRYEPYKQSEDVWHPLETCEFINVCGSICHMPSGSEPYTDEEE